MKAEAARAETERILAQQAADLEQKKADMQRRDAERERVKAQQARPLWAPIALHCQKVAARAWKPCLLP